jgi:hypothetical protein
MLDCAALGFKTQCQAREHVRKGAREGGEVLCAVGGLEMGEVVCKAVGVRARDGCLGSAGALGTTMAILKDVVGVRCRADEPGWMLCGCQMFSRII